MVYRESEVVKAVENSQRNLNVTLINELSVIVNKWIE